MKPSSEEALGRARSSTLSLPENGWFNKLSIVQDFSRLPPDVMAQDRYYMDQHRNLLLFLAFCVALKYFVSIFDD